MKASKTIKFDQFELIVSYDYKEPERTTGYPGSYEITEVLYRKEISKFHLQEIDILPFILEMSDDALFSIESKIDDDFTEKIKDEVFETIAKILKP